MAPTWAGPGLFLIAIEDFHMQMTPEVMKIKNKRFYKPKTSKNARGYPLIESENFRKKSRIVPKKTQRGDPLDSTCCTFGSIKILWFSARIEPPLSGFRNLVEDE